MKRYSAIYLILAAVIFVFTPPVYSQTADELKTLHAQYMGYLTARDLEKCKSMHAPGFQFDLVPLAAPLSEPEWQGYWTAVFNGFPDFNITDGVKLAVGNILVMEHMITGTHKGVWNGIPPSGKTYTQLFPHLDVYEFEGTTIKKVTTYGDMQGVMITLGAMPAPKLPTLTLSFTLPDPEPTGLGTVETDVEGMARWNTHDLSVWSKILTKDANLFFASLGIPLSRDAFVAMNGLYFQAFPDVKAEAVRRIDFGEGWILTEAIYKGTNTGPFFGIPATGKSLNVRLGLFSRNNSDGLKYYLHSYGDNLTILRQLGLLPTSAVKNGEMYK